MSEDNVIKYYTVTRQQEVKISATNPLDAAKMAQSVFDGEAITSGIGGARVTHAVKQRTLDVSEDY